MLWFILFFAPAAFGATEWWSRAVLESLIFILAAMCSLRRDFVAPLNVSLIGFAVIVALGVLQLLHARPLIEPAGLIPSTLSRPQTFYALLFWTALTALLWSASGILRWEGVLRRLLWVVFAVGICIAVVGILQGGQGNTDYYGLRPIRQGRPFGPFTNSDHAATWMVASAFVGAGLFASSFQRGRAPLTERIAQQILIAFALAVLIAGVFQANSRGGVNAFAVSALVTAFLAAGSISRDWPRRFMRLGVVLALGAYGLFLHTNPKWLGFVDGALDGSAAYRLSMYRSGLRMLADFPISGVGLCGFINAFHAYQKPLVDGLVDHVHCSWLEIALEAGLIGLIAFGAAVLQPLVALGRRLTAVDFPMRAAAAGCFAALLAAVLHGFVEFSFQIPADAVLYVVLLAAVSILLFAPSKPFPGDRRLRASLAGAFLLLAILDLPFGFVGLAPRLEAPFESASDTLVSSVEPRTAGLIQERERLLRNPAEPMLRYRYGVALWKAGRPYDADAYLRRAGDKK